MKHLYTIFVFTVLLIGCDLNKSDDMLASDTNVKINAGQEDIIPLSSTTPDTSSWIKILDKGAGYSYKSARPICVSFGPYKNSHVVISIAGKPKSPITYIFRAISNNADEIPAVSQLKLLERKGLLESTKIEIGGIETLNYGLTVKGWALAPNAGDRNLCFDTGRMAVKKILDYNLFPDQGSGLIAYEVSYEIGADLRDWVDNEVISTFKYKIDLPRVKETILVKGPKGYLYPSNLRARSLTVSGLPTPVEALEIIKRDGFIERLCAHSSCSNNTVNDFQVYYVGVPKGNMIQFRYSYSNDDAGTKMGYGYLNVGAQGKWRWGVRNTGFSTIGPIQEARSLRAKKLLE